MAEYGVSIDSFSFDVGDKFHYDYNFLQAFVTGSVASVDVIIPMGYIAPVF